MDMPPRLKTGHILIATGVVFAIVLAVVWLLLEQSRTVPPASQITLVAAIIALIGTLWTGLITFAGLMLKDSVDRRSAVLQADAERRQRIDTALRAVELMTKCESTGDAAKEGREAALLAISSLNQPRLSLRMADQFWRADKISTATFVQIVSTCLESDDDVAKREAATALRLGAAKLPQTPEQIEFPDAFCMAWDDRLPALAKDDLLGALVRAMCARERDWWDRGMLNWALYCFYKMFTRDQNRRFRYISALLAKDLCRSLDYNPGDFILPFDRHTLEYAEIERAAEAVMAELGAPIANIGTNECELRDELSAWLENRTEEPTPVPPTSST